ncbi:MAG: hypothetical protein EI684_21415 [Candidatus Viridilinea halotolerans]|uniref:Uncharacterized protein n=1 Tax=Candidatus Viridilinea halotolerans TaxID=2491704 RepID=A0A426TRD2_9CHLR|nr:MAG: hypothetical protein EI684_21415 [Candidatus Viridilinea halotolerans]
MITLVIHDLLADYHNELIFDRELAEEVYRRAVEAHPFLAAINNPKAILNAVADLPAGVANAYGEPTPHELAEQIFTQVTCNPRGTTVIPLRPMFALVIQQVTPSPPGEPPIYSGSVISTGAQRLAGPWTAFHPGTILVRVLDDPTFLDHLEQRITTPPTARSA